VLVLLGAHLFGSMKEPSAVPGTPALLAVLAGAGGTLTAAGLLLHFTVGLHNYIHWTIEFAAQRRLPGLEEMIGVYREPALLWMLPCVAIALLLLRSPTGRGGAEGGQSSSEAPEEHTAGAKAPTHFFALTARLKSCPVTKLSFSASHKGIWARVLALGLLAAPFLWTLASLLVYDDADERGDSLLVLWPLLLILSAALTVINLRRGLSLRALLPAILLAAINGTLMSQQLWGSTYAIWPLLILLVAEMIVFLDQDERPGGAPRRLAVAPVMAAVVSAALLLCGGFYTASEERLSYAQFPEGPLVHATAPRLAGMATTGPYLPEFEELLRFAAANIPASDGLILIPGEDPFYFATGRNPQFPVLLFDPATDPYSPGEIVEQARAHRIRWLIVKRELQIKADPTPQREAVMKALLGEFAPYRQLRGYDVYRR
jgi:hypothetical protein